jgi:hypothetical protein
MALSHTAGDRLLAAARRAELAAEAPPGSVLGLEQEYLVRAASGERIDFRRLLPSLELPGAAIDPGDRFARRMPSGIAITADVNEAEIALPPLRRRRDYAASLAKRAEFALATLDRALPAELELEGYSTHLSVSMPDALNDAVCQLYARTFAAAAILLTDAAEANGILIRPRPGRTEIGVDYLVDGWLRVAALFVTASVRACAAAVAGRAVALPPVLQVRVDDGVERFGWYVDRTAFGGDLLVEGRAAQLTTSDGRTISGHEALAEAWAAVQPWLDGAAPADLKVAQRMIDGWEPLPHEVPRSVIAGIARKGPSAPARRHLTTFFGDVIKPHRRRGLSVSARLATWDYTIFALARDGEQREVFVSVPAGMLGAFLDELDGGRLDDWLAEQLTTAAAAPALQRWEQTQRLEVFASLGDNRGLVRTERAPAGATTGDRAGKAVTTSTTTPDEPRTGGGPPWLIIGGLILLGLAVAIGGGIGFNLFGGNTALPTATPSEDPCFSDPQFCQPESPTPSPTQDPCSIDPAICQPESPTPPVPTLLTPEEVLTALELAYGPNFMADPAHDWSEPDAALDPPLADIFRAGAGMVTLTKPIGCNTYIVAHVVECSGTIGTPNATYDVSLFQLGAPIAGTEGAFLEVGVAAFDQTPPGGGSPEPLNSGDLSFLTGANTFYSLRFPAPSLGTPVLIRLVHSAGEPFLHEEETTAFAIVRDDLLALFVPVSEWDGVADYRQYTYFQDQPSGASVSDTAPAMTEPMTLFDPANSYTIGDGGIPAVTPPVASSPIGMSNSITDQTFSQCSSGGTVVWTPSPGESISGTGTVEILGPTMAGTQTVAVSGNEVRLPLTFAWGAGDRNWLITLTSVDGRPVRPAPAGANGSQFSYTAPNSPSC